MIQLQDDISVSSIVAAIASRVRERRRELGMSQSLLAKRSGVSLGSIKRFETQHKISFESLIKISIALNCADDFSELFAHKQYRSIQDVINEQ
ncbi:MAG: helix-turn-helix transcriptional regulator [Coriobacteriales bacterium]|jgi:transcriptional regulator with XRE-family HTH domain|nr:helix-turn-helix transcriptional regulator [Coriobacteriales bacterium]